MRKHILSCTILMLLLAARVRAQDSYNDRAQQYIRKYSALAIQEQRRSGIPASITLGQGILETEAGASELMTQANNHFGIKCKMDWDGEKFLHTDDAPMECFKKYKCAEDSYKDHSDYLKRNPRYNPLFVLKPTDYKGWAVCLKRCGYATNPQYAQNLIKIIENFNLQDYTYTALDSSILNNHAESNIVMDDEPVKAGVSPIQSTADSARNFIAKKTTPTLSAAPPTDIDSSKIVTINGMKAFYAHKGEMLLSYAVRYKVRYAHLLEMNDLPDGPLPFNTCIYLEKKQTLGTHATHVVKSDENLLMISQLEGVQLKKLMAMNMLNPNEEPVPGSVIYLQSATANRPDVKTNAIVAHKSNAIVTGADTVKQDNDLIATDWSKPVAKPIVADTMVTYKNEPVVALAPKPQPIIDTPKPHAVAPTHVIVVKQVDEPVHKQPVVAQTYVPAKAAAAIEKQDATTEEEFIKLKADLDKVVYADDSKLVAKMTSTQPQQKTIEEPSSNGAKYYTVKRGDTAFSIAKRNNITVDDLLKWNEMDASGVKAGKSLRIK